MEPTLALVIRLTVGALVFATGLAVPDGRALALRRRPAFLLRAFIAMYVLTPLAALALARLFVLPAGVEAALLVLSVSGGAPLLVRRLARLGRGEVVVGLVVATGAAAVVTVPAWAVVLDPLFDRAIRVAPGPLFVLVATTVLLPLAAGLALARVRPALAARISRVLGRVGRALLLIVLLALLVFRGRDLLAIGPAAWGALGAFALLALGIGFALGGRDRDERTVLAVFCATRHLGIALLLATTLAGEGTRLLIIAYALAAFVLTTALLRIRSQAPGGRRRRQLGAWLRMRR